MFLPKAQTEQAAEAQAEKQRREAYVRIEGWAIEEIPAAIRDGVQINVQEVQCGDPNCAPIDTAIAIMFPSGGRGMLGLPMEANEVTKAILAEAFPTKEVLAAWHRGEDAEWPPYEEEEYDEATQRPKLRFEIGEQVECRIGPDPVTGWAAGEIIQLWYREQNWPPNSWAPYKIRLEDGRNIFAPGDIDQIIRKKQAVG